MNREQLLILVHPLCRHYQRLELADRRGDALDAQGLKRVDGYLHLVAQTLDDERREVIIMEEAQQFDLVNKIKEKLNPKARVIIIPTKECRPEPVDGWSALFDRTKPYKNQTINLGDGYYWTGKNKSLSENGGPDCAGFVHQKLLSKGYKVELERPLIFPELR